jgi:hypothetical protein
MIRAVYPEGDVFVPRVRTMKADISLQTSVKRVVIPALIDSGVTENCIDRKFIRKYKLPATKLLKPRIVRNADNSPNSSGIITHSVNLELQYAGKPQQFRFLVTDLGDDSIVLGYPFLAHNNPPLDWTTGRLFGSKAARTSKAHLYAERATKARAKDLRLSNALDKLDELEHNAAIAARSRQDVHIKRTTIST